MNAHTGPTAAGLVERLLAALPQVRPEHEEVRAHAEAEGMLDELPELFLQECSFALLGRRTEGPPDFPRWQAWVDALAAEWGRDPHIDDLIMGYALVQVPDPKYDVHGVRATLGPTLLAAVDAQLERERLEENPAMRALAERLVAGFPELAPLVGENTDDGDGVLLGTMFLADVARQVVEHQLTGKPERARALLDAVEAELGRDATLDNTIGTGFVEALPLPGEPGDGILTLLGPRLLASYRDLGYDQGPIRGRRGS